MAAKREITNRTGVSPVQRGGGVAGGLADGISSINQAGQVWLNQAVARQKQDAIQQAKEDALASVLVTGPDGQTIPKAVFTAEGGSPEYQRQYRISATQFYMAKVDEDARLEAERLISENPDPEDFTKLMGSYAQTTMRQLEGEDEFIRDQAASIYDSVIKRGVNALGAARHEQARKSALAVLSDKAKRVQDDAIAAGKAGVPLSDDRMASLIEDYRNTQFASQVHDGRTDDHIEANVEIFRRNIRKAQLQGGVMREFIRTDGNVKSTIGLFESAATEAEEQGDFAFAEEIRSVGQAELERQIAKRNRVETYEAGVREDNYQDLLLSISEGRRLDDQEINNLVRTGQIWAMQGISIRNIQSGLINERRNAVSRAVQTEASSIVTMARNAIEEHEGFDESPEVKRAIEKLGRLEEKANAAGMSGAASMIRNLKDGLDSKSDSHIRKEGQLRFENVLASVESGQRDESALYYLSEEYRALDPVLSRRIRNEYNAMRKASAEAGKAEWRSTIRAAEKQLIDSPEAYRRLMEIGRAKGWIETDYEMRSKIAEYSKSYVARQNENAEKAQVNDLRRNPYTAFVPKSNNRFGDEVGFVIPEDPTNPNSELVPIDMENEAHWQHAINLIGREKSIPDPVVQWLSASFQVPSDDPEAAAAHEEVLADRLSFMSLWTEIMRRQGKGHHVKEILSEYMGRKEADTLIHKTSLYEKVGISAAVDKPRTKDSSSAARAFSNAYPNATGGRDIRTNVEIMLSHLSENGFDAVYGSTQLSQLWEAYTGDDPASKAARQVGFSPLHGTAGLEYFNPVAAIGESLLGIFSDDRLPIAPDVHQYFTDKVSVRVEELLHQKSLDGSFDLTESTYRDLQMEAFRDVLVENRDALSVQTMPGGKGKVLSFGNIVADARKTVPAGPLWGVDADLDPSKIGHEEIIDDIVIRKNMLSKIDTDVDEEGNPTYVFRKGRDGEVSDLFKAMNDPDNAENFFFERNSFTPGDRPSYRVMFYDEKTRKTHTVFENYSYDYTSSFQNAAIKGYVNEQIIKDNPKMVRLMMMIPIIGASVRASAVSVEASRQRADPDAYFDINIVRPLLLPDLDAAFQGEDPFPELRFAAPGLERDIARLTDFVASYGNRPVDESGHVIDIDGNRVRVSKEQKERWETIFRLRPGEMYQRMFGVEAKPLER